MNYIISKIAFRPPETTYDLTLSYLHFVERNDYFIPIRKYHISSSLPVMLICQGNAEDIGMSDPKQLSKDFNVNVCLFDYAGYGLHTVKYSSESECRKDVVAVYNYLRNDYNEIIIYGRSLGSGVATYLSYLLCKQQIPNKLILISPLYSCVNILTNINIPGDIFKNYTYAPFINSKVLIIHGDSDNIVPYTCGKNLSLLFQNCKFITVKNCGHNDILMKYDIKDIIEFINND